MNVRLASSSRAADGFSFPGHLSQGPKGVDTEAGVKLVQGGSSRIGWNGGDAHNSHCASLNHPSLVVGVLLVYPSIGGGSIVCDCGLSAMGLDAGSDKWCRLQPSLLDDSCGGMGVIPTSPEERIL